jgi:hypothetical protein
MEEGGCILLLPSKHIASKTRHEGSSPLLHVRKHSRKEEEEEEKGEDAKG